MIGTRHAVEVGYQPALNEAGVFFARLGKRWQMGTVLVDGQAVKVGDDERINAIQAAERAGIDIPRYFWHPGLSVVASCRMCLIEAGQRHPQTGEISFIPKLVPACQTPAKDGAVFATDTAKVKNARAQVEEDLLLRHPVDCPICDKSGECYLQDYHFQYGQKERRADIRPFSSRRRDVGATVTLFVDRCIMCTRCIRFCREVTGTSELMVVNRGTFQEIDVVPGFPLNNKLAGNVVDLCPVGALTDVDFLYQQRVWFMKRHTGVCTRCATGCSIWTEENQDHVYRIKPRDNPDVNRWWICDDGRYGFHHVHDAERQTSLCRRQPDGLEHVLWEDLPQQIHADLVAAGRLAVVLSPFLTVEEAYLLASYIRSIDPHALLAMGPLPFEGQDQRFSNGFVIHAEKCPNRRGVEAVIRHFAGDCLAFEDFLQILPDAPIWGIWVTGGYPQPMFDARVSHQFEHVDLLIVQDLFATPLWDLATYQLPGAAFAERSGSYVNYADWLQSASWAVRPPAGVWVEGQLYWRLLGRQGLFNARKVLSEVAADVPFFARAEHEVPPTGLSLRLTGGDAPQQEQLQGGAW
jgi:NADH-quinone oxidoreductase subunit G